MPRFKSTRMLLIVILIICITLLFANLWFDWRADKIYEHYLHKNISLVSKKVTTEQKSPNYKSFWRTKAYNNRTNYQKPWFMTNGTLRPSTFRNNHSKLRPILWPEQSDEDRIVNQLMFYPRDYNSSSTQLKTIVLYLGRGGWSDLPMGRAKFISDKCPIDRCYLSGDPNDAVQADAIFFKERFQWPKHRRPPHQIWILFLLECPLHTQLFRNLGIGVFNWTATYRHDSDIVAPYEKFVSYHQNVSINSPKKVCNYYVF